ITERKQAEETLKESEARLRSVVRVAPTGIGVVADRVVMQANERMCEMTGYSEEELVGQGARMLYPTDEDFEYVGREKYAQIRKHGTGTVETRWRRKGGGIIDVLLGSTPLDPNDFSKGITFTALDITERKQAEAALRESEERFRDLADSLPQTVYEIDVEGKLTYVNANALEVFGYSEADLDCGLFAVDMIAPDDRQRAGETLQRIAVGEDVGANEYAAINKDRSTFPVIIHSRRIIQAGKLVGIRGIIVDITERKQAEESIKKSEEKLQKLISNISDVIVIFDKDGFTKYKSPNLTENFGWKPEELIGKDGLFTVHPDDKKRVKKEFTKIKKKDNAKTTFEYKYLCKDGSYKPVEITAVNLISDPLIKGVLANYNNISVRKDAEKAIMENQRLGAIGEMASSVAHDFNNSLQAIFGNLELAMLNSDLPEVTINYLKAMKNAAGDAANRVQLLQRFGGKKQTESLYEPINLNNIVEDVIIQSRPLWKDAAEKKGISISLEPKYGDIPKIHGNDGELRSVIYNIIKNSIEAMPQGGKITLLTGKTKEIGKPGEKEKGACLTIKDTGTGMDEETKTRVFQPFFSTKGFELGRGLGMSGVYSIVQEHKGEIYVKKTAWGKGTSIEIILPYSKEEDKKEDENAAVDYEGSVRILWVDDEEMVRLLAKEYLEALGHDGDIAESGQEALELLDKNEYDLVITDIGMPGMSGWQLAEKIKNKFSGQMKVAALTGWGAQVGKEEKIKHGVGYVLGKPVRLDEFKNLIREVIQSS
ncbi:MAG: PAS domain S-box protein, partial [Calditrichia bacterium]|nr:PAS domain S-box protein [Calditrichia bacterium]